MAPDPCPTGHIRLADNVGTWEQSGLRNWRSCYCWRNGGRIWDWLDTGRDMVRGIPDPSPLDTACHVGEPLDSGECVTSDFFHWPVISLLIHGPFSDTGLMILAHFGSRCWTMTRLYIPFHVDRHHQVDQTLSVGHSKPPLVLLTGDTQVCLTPPSQ